MQAPDRVSHVTLGGLEIPFPGIQSAWLHLWIMNILTCNFVSYDGNSFAIDLFASKVRLHVIFFTPNFPPSLLWGKPNIFHKLGACDVEHGHAGDGARADHWNAVCKDRPGDKAIPVWPPLQGPFQDFGELGGRCHLSMDGGRETRDLARSSSSQKCPNVWEEQIGFAKWS